MSPEIGYTGSSWFLFSSLLFHISFLIILFIYTRNLVEILTSACVCAKLLQSCPNLFDCVDCNLPGSSVHGILQARILE